MQGCAVSPSSTRGESDARRAIAVADSLREQSEFAHAAEAYTLVAGRYPSSNVYPRAVRNAGFLLASPANSARDDSAAIRWLSLYATLPASEAERDGISLLGNALQETIALRAQSTHLTAEADSLYALSKRQSAAILVEQRKSRELEEKLKEAMTELAKLKSVDVRTARSRRSR
jgi:hypothetical protein